MADKIKELLSVLDLPEEEQREWYRTRYGERWERWGCKNCLESEAFRLRDEVIAKDDKSEIDCWWCEASYQVYLYIIGEENEKDAEGLDTWFSMRAQPIHWIIAALIAKELTDEQK